MIYQDRVGYLVSRKAELKGRYCLSRDGALRGLIVGARDCTLQDCNGIRIIVRWPDGSSTHPCLKVASSWKVGILELVTSHIPCYSQTCCPMPSAVADSRFRATMHGSRPRPCVGFRAKPRRHPVHDAPVRCRRHDIASHDPHSVEQRCCFAVWR
jgi:hypothetical protein